MTRMALLVVGAALALSGCGLPEVRRELRVGLLANRAGVEHDDVRRLLASRLHVPSGLQRAGESLGVVRVHLAPKRVHYI